MKVLFRLFGAFALLGMSSWAAGQFSQSGFGNTRQMIRNCAGTQCPGVRTGYECGPSGFDVTPNPVVASASQPMTIRFDSSQICNGMSARILPGASISFEAGATLPLPDSYGLYTHTYQQAGSQKIRLEMSFVCSDPKGESTCTSKGSVDVTVK